jgi:hypothetical protein
MKKVKEENSNPQTETLSTLNYFLYFAKYTEKSLFNMN